MTAPLWITEAEVAELLSMAEAIEALEQGLRLEADGAARTMVKTHAAWGDGHTLHAIGATMEGQGLVGAKVWAHTQGGATPILVLWHAETGGLAAIVEAFALGQLRTGGMTGVATRLLAAAGADELAQIGSGRQALPQVAAVAAVRPLRRIRVFSPTAAHAEAMAAALRAALPDTRDRPGRGCGALCRRCADRQPGDPRPRAVPAGRDAGAGDACERRRRDHARAGGVRPGCVRPGRAGGRGQPASDPPPVARVHHLVRHG